MYVAFTALRQTFQHEDFPESLAIKVELLPVLFPLHMFSGGMALVLVPLAYALRRHPRWHRPLGVVAGIDVLLAGLTAYPVALLEPVTAWSAAGFTAQATTWLALLGAGVWNIMAGRVAAHRACMLMMGATMTGAVFFRIYLALWAILAHGRYFELFYACDAWIAWLLPLALTAYLLKRTGGLAIVPR